MKKQLTEKLCRRCGNVKSIDNFTLRSNGYYVSNCKPCEVNRVKEYEQKHPDRRPAYDKEYSTKNRDEKNKYFRDRRANNRNKVHLYEQEYRSRNKARINARLRNYYAKNPFVYKAIAHRYLGHKQAAKGTHSKTDIAELYDLQDGRCAYCGMPVGDNFQLDHIHPISRGGSNGIENLAIACKSCNASKGDRFLWEWQERFQWMFKSASGGGA